MNVDNWVAGWGDGITGPTCPSSKPLVDEARKFGIVSCEKSVIAICPDQLPDLSWDDVDGRGRTTAEFIVEAVKAYEPNKELIEKLKKALMFYAWVHNWENNEDSGTSLAAFNRGEYARGVLQELTGWKM